MKYTADTWFFIKLADKDEKALKIWGEIIEGKGRLVVPTIVLVELTRSFLRKNLAKDLENLIFGFEKSKKIFLVDLTPEIAKLAGKFADSYDIPTVDSVILATADVTEFTDLLSGDKHFIPAFRDGKIRLIRF